MKTKFQLLLTAIENEDLKSLDSLLKDREVIDEILKNQKEASHRAPLYLAAIKGSLPVMNRLLQEKEILQGLEETGIIFDIFNEIIDNDRIKILERLLEEQEVKTAIEKDAARESGPIPNRVLIRAAAVKGNLDIVEILLKNDVIKKNAHKALIFAVTESGRNLAVVKRLLQVKTVQDNVAQNDNEALRRAVETGNEPIALSLLAEKRVQKNLAARENATLFYAIKNHFSSVKEILLQDENVLVNLATGNKETRRLLAKSGDLVKVAHKILQYFIMDSRYEDPDVRIPILKGLLNEKEFRDNISNDNHAVLKQALQERGNGALDFCYLIIDTYKKNGLKLPDPNSLGNFSKYILDYLKDDPLEKLYIRYKVLKTVKKITDKSKQIEDEKRLREKRLQNTTRAGTASTATAANPLMTQQYTMSTSRTNTESDEMTALVDAVKRGSVDPVKESLAKLNPKSLSSEWLLDLLNIAAKIENLSTRVAITESLLEKLKSVMGYVNKLSPPLAKG